MWTQTQDKAKKVWGERVGRDKRPQNGVAQAHEPSAISLYAVRVG